jgi:hypothetical protein
MSLLLVGLDNTIVNVALPSIGRELHAAAIAVCAFAARAAERGTAPSAEPALSPRRA